MSINSRILLPVFDDLSVKWLHIPYVIDDYNHYINGVDQSNQLHKYLTAHRPFKTRNWRPL